MYVMYLYKRAYVCLSATVCLSELQSSLTITLYFMVHASAVDTFIGWLIGSIDSDVCVSQSHGVSVCNP